MTESANPVIKPSFQNPRKSSQRELQERTLVNTFAVKSDLHPC